MRIKIIRNPNDESLEELFTLGDIIDGKAYDVICKYKSSYNAIIIGGEFGSEFEIYEGEYYEVVE